MNLRFRKIGTLFSFHHVFLTKLTTRQHCDQLYRCNKRIRRTWWIHAPPKIEIIIRESRPATIGCANVLEIWEREREREREDVVACTWCLEINLRNLRQKSSWLHVSISVPCLWGLVAVVCCCSCLACCQGVCVLVSPPLYRGTA